MSRGLFCGVNRHSLWIESHRPDGNPVTGGAGPPLRVGATGAFVELATANKDVVLVTEVALIGRHVPDRTVSMYAVVPVDEASNSGLTNSPTSTFVLSGLLIDDRDWLSALDQTVAFRRFLKANFYIAPRAELKATWLIHNKGDIRKSGLAFSGRMAAYKAAMRFQRKCGLFRTFAILIDKAKITTATDIRELAWRFALQRLERFGTSRKDNINVIPDEGHGIFIRKKIREMRRFSFVPSAYGPGSLDRKAENIVEDPSDRSSHESYFIQLADLNAYAAFRHVFPAPRFGAGLLG